MISFGNLEFFGVYFLLDVRQESRILVSKAGAQYMGFFGLSPDLKMRACSGVILVTYPRN
jgi:hypothetical protein